MIDKILQFSIRWRYFMVMSWLVLAGWGFYAALQLPIDAVPDVTTNQVQVNTRASGFSPLEMEQYVTFPIELAMSSLPRKEEIRSISQFGLSQVTITFDEGADIYWARQLVLERLLEAREQLPPEVSPELSPISTGLGEIYQFTVESDGEHTSDYSLIDLRTILDWFIKPQLRTVPGVIDVNSFGGRLKEYEVLVDPQELVNYNLALPAIVKAIQENNSNVGGAYLERGGEQLLLRGMGLISSVQDIEQIVVMAHSGTPIRVKDVAEVRVGSAVRYGAATRDGKGEVVMGMAMLLKGENSRTVTEAVKQKIKSLEGSLPSGVHIRPFYDRSQLVNETIRTATTNLVEGGLLVILVLFLFLLQLRAGLIVSSAIPLSMLFAIIGMKQFGISANLMSLGAIDFGLIVDAAVIIVENCVRRLAKERKHLGRSLTSEERLKTIWKGSTEVRRASQFGEICIIAAYIPIVSLAGIEGKMFRPMAFTVILALVGALILSLTLIPALSAIFLRDRIERKNPILRLFIQIYKFLLFAAIRYRWVTVSLAVCFVIVCLALFPFLGAEFLPELDEGSIAINHIRLKSASLSEAVRQTSLIEKTIKEIREVSTVVSRIGRPEIATDPMGPDMVDTYVFLKPKSEWGSQRSKEDLIEEMSHKLEEFPGVVASFSQPIKFRMMELIEGVGARSDVVVKIFGDDLETLLANANQVATVLQQVPGASDVRVQQIAGLPMLQFRINRTAIARHGINVSDVQAVIQTAIAGKKATTIMEGFMRFDGVVRFIPEVRNSVEDFTKLLVAAPGGEYVPLGQLADIWVEEGPAEISRESGQRRISVEVNVPDRDIGSFVAEAQDKVDQSLQLPAGYIMEWGGMFEHLESGRNRLLVAVPITFLLIFLLLFTTFNSARQALLVFTGIPFAITGGILSLLVRDMYFSMSAGIGFIAVSGVAVLNGILMVTFINHLQEKGWSPLTAVCRGAVGRLRPVLMTALVASLGFLPMALSTSTGAEVQRPLATVVIGGLITSTILTLLVLPVIYLWFGKTGPANKEDIHFDR